MSLKYFKLFMTLFSIRAKQINSAALSGMLLMNSLKTLSAVPFAHRHDKHDTKHDLCEGVVRRFAVLICAAHNYNNNKDCIWRRN